MSRVVVDRLVPGRPPFAESSPPLAVLVVYTPPAPAMPRTLSRPVLPPDRRALPRRYIRAPSPGRIRDWAEREAGSLGRHPVLCWSILEYLSCNPGLELGDLRLHVCGDTRWRKRKTRTPLERLAYRGLVSYDPERRILRAVWVIPRVS